MQKLFATLFFCLLGTEAVQAQKGEDLYAAPGMPVTVARRLSAEVVPTAKSWFTQPLPRFWKSSDSLIRQREWWQFRQALAQRVHYPKLALINQLGGAIQIRALVAPDGTLLAVSIIESILTLELPNEKAGEALQTEALRVAHLLRFQPKPGSVDTIDFPVMYRFL